MNEMRRIKTPKISKRCIQIKLSDRPPVVVQYSRRKNQGMTRADDDGSGGSGNHFSGDHS